MADHIAHFAPLCLAQPLRDTTALPGSLFGRLIGATGSSVLSRLGFARVVPASMYVLPFPVFL
jgi:hypothetical protein